MVLITCLANVASQVGVGRVIAGNKFHYPVGQPELPPPEELNWRVALIEKALATLENKVEESKIL